MRILIALNLLFCAQAEAFFIEGLPLTCRILTYHLFIDHEGNEAMYTQISDAKGAVKKTISEDYAAIDFSKWIKEQKLEQRFNPHVQDRNINDCIAKRSDIVKLGLGE